LTEEFNSPNRPFPLEVKDVCYITQCVIAFRKCICQNLVACKSVGQFKHSARLWRRTDHATE